MKTILVVDDDPAIVRGLTETLTAEHFQVLSAPSLARARTLVHREPVDLIILDLLLPDGRGEDLCRDLRRERCTAPVLMLTSKAEEADKVAGLEVGADDYVTKPFGLRELVARVRALLRRGGDIRSGLEEFSFGEVAVNFRRAEFRRGGALVPCTVRELEVLRYFILHEGEVVTRDMLLDEVWGYEHFPTTRTVDNFILSLRKKCEPDPAHPVHFLTVHAAGYRFLR